MMARSSFWSRLTTLLLVVAATLTLTVSRQSGAIVLADVLEQLPAEATATTHVLSYQGRLADPATGAAKPDGSYSMTFRIYDAAMAGATLWTEIKDVTVSKGLFSTLLGDTTALPSTIFDGNDRWLGVKVLSDAETAPRMRLAFAPYASWAMNAGNLGGQNSAFYRNATNLNAGTVADGRLDARITRDGEVFGLVTGADGVNSGLDADLLDGQDSAFYRNADNLNAGQLSTNNFSALNDLNAEGAIGSGAGQVAQGAHTHIGLLAKIGTIDSTCLGNVGFGTTFMKVADIGTFTKSNDSSLLEVTFNGRIAVITSLSGAGARFELRVDDGVAAVGRARASFKASEVGSDGRLVSMAGFFAGLPAGTHTVSMWVAASSGTGNGAMLDPGCWNSDSVLIKEYLDSAGGL